MEVLPPVDDEPLFDELLPELFELLEPLDGLEELLPLLLLELLDELLLELFLLLEEVFPDVEVLPPVVVLELDVFLFVLLLFETTFLSVASACFFTEFLTVFVPSSFVTTS